MKKAKGIGAANKRRRLQESEAYKYPILKEIFGDDAVAEAKTKLQQTGPFPHAVIHPVCHEARLKEAFDQSLNSLSADLRESDS